MQHQTVPQTTAEPTEPDYWLTLADDLRHIADRLTSMAGTEAIGGQLVVLSLYGNYDIAKADRSAPVVDALAEVFGAKAKTTTEGRGRLRSTERKMSADIGRVHVFARASMPTPPTRQQSKAALEARVAELEAQLAQDGAK